LDLDTVQALIRGLANFEGVKKKKKRFHLFWILYLILIFLKKGVFVISHDESLITALCDELWAMEPGKVKHFILILLYFH